MDEQLSKKPLKEAIKSEIKQRLVEAGIKAFARYGFHGAKIAAIAREAGVANGTFYLHFKDKDVLYAEIVRRGIAKLASGLFAAHHAPAGVSVDRAEIEVVLEFAEHNRDLMRIALENNSQGLPDAGNIFAPLLELREREIKKGIEQGSISREINPMLASRAELAMLLTTIQWWLDHRQLASRAELVNTLTQLRRAWALSDNGDLDDIDALLRQWDPRL